MNFKASLVALASATFAAGCGDDLMVSDGPSPASLFGSTGRRNLVVATVGLETQPALLAFNVPAATAAEIVSARLYWVGRGTSPVGDNRILIKGVWRVGTLLASQDVGGDLPWVFYYEYDATGLIRHGNNNLYVSDFNLGTPSRADGIAAVVVYNDPTSPWTDIHTIDPHEFVSGGAGAVWDLPIGGCADARNARLVLVAGDGTSALTDRVWWSSGPGASPPDLVGGGSGVFDDRLGATSGNWMDVVDESVSVPAYATHFAYQLESPSAGGDDIVHVFGAVCIDGEPTSCTGAISGSVWQDDDRDGVHDGTEPGLAGVPVTLRDGLGAVLTAAVTEVSGTFAFPLLCAGDYSVEVDESALPDGLESTTCATGVCNPMGVGLATDDGTASVDFGYGEPASAGTRCFLRMSFWKQQFRSRPGSHGRCRLDEATMNRIVLDVDAATGMNWKGGDGTLSASDIARQLHGNRTEHCEWVERYYLVSLLNWALNGSDPGMTVDTDFDGEMDMVFSAYIAEVERLLTRGDREDARRAKRMVISVDRMPDEGCDLLFGNGAEVAEISRAEDEW